MSDFSHSGVQPLLSDPEFRFVVTDTIVYENTDYFLHKIRGGFAGLTEVEISISESNIYGESSQLPPDVNQLIEYDTDDIDIEIEIDRDKCILTLYVDSADGDCVEGVVEGLFDYSISEMGGSFPRHEFECIDEWNNVQEQW